MPNETPIFSLSGFSSFFNKKGLLGVKEVGNNKAFTNAVVSEMLKTVGWTSGESYCASLLKAVLLQVFPFDKDFIKKNFTKAAYVNYTAINALNKKGDMTYITIDKPQPQIGDVVVWRKGTTMFGHTGLVTGLISDVKVKTIEGNTSEALVREGDGIYENTRNVAIGAGLGDLKFVGYIRRNFTEAEKADLYWDEDRVCYAFKSKETAPIGSTLAALGSGFTNYLKRQ